MKRHRSGLYLPVPSPADPQPWLHGLGSPITIAPPPPPSQTIIGNFDGSTGDFSQWGDGTSPSGTNAVEDTPHVGTAAVGSHTLCSIIAAPPGMQPGNPFAFKCETFGDSTGQTTSIPAARAELHVSQPRSNFVMGTSSWWEGYHYFPSGVDFGATANAWSNNSHMIFMQFGGTAGFNAPQFNLQWGATGTLPVWQFTTYTGTSTAPHTDIQQNLFTIAFDTVYHWKLFVTFSQTKATGAVQLFVNDVEVVPLQAAQTHCSNGTGTGSYFKSGSYRFQANGGRNGTAIHNGIKNYTIP